MTIRRTLHRLLTDRRGAHAFEFVIIATVFFPLSFAMLELGFLLWTQNAMQSAATIAARCGAIGGSACPDIAVYAASAVGEWVVPDSITSSDVTVTSGGSCNGAPGLATIVVIAHQFWGTVTFPWPFSAPLITVTSCFPSAT